MSLVLDAVTFRYSNRGPWVLTGVNLQLEAGQTCALMAPSGEGKSTLLSIAAGMLQPTGGTVSVGRDARNGRPDGNESNDITWIFQGPSVLSRRTALDNVALPLVARGATHADAAPVARAALSRVGLADYGGQQVRHLSGGQAQRVAIARALVTRPAVVLADEPTASLDYDTGRAVCETLFTEMKEAAVLMATHDLRIAQLADTIVTLQRGKVIWGTT
ncbi:ABC transporter ATP-binding protein [Demequina sp.]|uniref:ABC transporter ATP-binding protein n=1 Tax=Demequina sp. TaxID=2050685 RepID=UPI003D0EA169